MTILGIFRTTRANLWLLIVGIVVGAAAELRLCFSPAEGLRRIGLGLQVTVGESGTVDVLQALRPLRIALAPTQLSSPLRLWHRRLSRTP